MSLDQENVQFIGQRGGIRGTFDVGDSFTGQRTETPAIPSRSIREAVVNSLMHRSYEGFALIQITRFAN
jgi:ATP-dependent DNA helicase RecG